MKRTLFSAAAILTLCGTAQAAPTFSLDGGRLEIAGTDGDDGVVVEARGRTLWVYSVDHVLLGDPGGAAGAGVPVGPELAFATQGGDDALLLDAASVQVIVFDGGDGDDYFRNDSDIPAVADGGDGADHLFGGAAADWLDAGGDSGGGVSSVSGGGGADVLADGAHDDLCSAGRTWVQSDGAARPGPTGDLALAGCGVVLDGRPEPAPNG